MRRVVLPLLTAIGVLGPAIPGQVASQEPKHFLNDMGWGHGKLGAKVLDARLVDAARAYASYGQLPRIALFDLALPKDPEEAIATGGYGVVVITAMSQDSLELPLAAVMLRNGEAGRSIQLLRAERSFLAPTLGDSVARVIGRFREDLILALPLQSMVAGDTLVLDFAIRRKGFVLNVFSPDDFPGLARFAAGPLLPAPSMGPLRVLIAREYPELALP